MGITREGLSNHINGTPRYRCSNVLPLLLVAAWGIFAPQPSNTITRPKCGTVLEVKEGGKVMTQKDAIKTI